MVLADRPDRDVFDHDQPSYPSALAKVVKSKPSEVSISAYAWAIRRGVSVIPSDPMG